MSALGGVALGLLVQCLWESGARCGRFSRHLVLFGRKQLRTLVLLRNQGGDYEWQSTM
jgi:hypothetical protein